MDESGVAARTRLEPGADIKRLKLEGCGCVSHETIYLHIYKNKAAGKIVLIP